MQKLNKAALKYILFLALSMSMVDLFTYCYFNIELIIGIDILGLELVFVRCACNWYAVIGE